ncbi:HD-GYP domain-containing protein [Desulfallas thermosapovorans]|uniref:HD domain-containing protein n=1 Tax=Desulfallas thermosapovorans DSM 6562 TaxID=1121431 RepID=A0A5S4ZSW3_9FIRM|nr:HD domain-containing phosphohydrolase [Desulfallas thermosapovorans]TYO96036.1 HD domain-containing protein [Desulfallas thermosapovorans DSM 6562]
MHATVNSSITPQLGLYKLLRALSLAMDYNRNGLMRHHQRVALICSYLAEEMQLEPNTLPQLYCSAVIHDAGTSTFSEKADLEKFETIKPWQHCERGYRLLNTMPVLAPLAETILHHHDRWDGQNPSGLAGNAIPLHSRIIFLADRVDVLAQQPGGILDNREDIVRRINNHSGTMFDPELVNAFNRAARKESLWLDLTSQFIDSILDSRLSTCPAVTGQEEIIGVSEIFAEIIDSKSPFTHRHSRLVANTAALLAGKAGFTSRERKNMYVAGLLHDLGKLSIPEEILEKPSGLDKREYNAIKQHTYITYQILNMIDGFEEITRWAAYHHEKLNGEGYPFHLTAADLPTGSRIMAVADIFSALAEDRPYRRGLPRPQVAEIMNRMVKSNSIDGEIVEILMDNYREAEMLKDELAAQ